MRYVTLSGTRYAVDLLWQIELDAEKRKAVLRHAQTVAEELGEANVDCIAVRPYQFALGKSPEPMPRTPRTYPLAASLPDLIKLPGYIGVFHLDSTLWWVFGAATGNVISLGDKAFEDRDEAVSAAEEVLHLFGEGPKIAYYETPEESLAFLGSRLRPQHPLEAFRFGSAEHRSRQKKVLAGCALLGVFFLLYMAWSAYEDQQAADRARLARQATDRASVEALAHPERHFRQAWLDAPPVPAAAGQCVERMMAVPVVEAGWLLKEIICEPGSRLSVSRAHVDGADYLHPVLTDAKFLSAKETSHTATLPALRKISAVRHTDLLPVPRVTAYLYQLAQSLHLNLENLSWSSPEKREDKASKLTLTAPWQQGTFTFSSVPARALLDPELFQILALPGASLSGINYQAAPRLWRIKGVVYAAR